MQSSVPLLVWAAPVLGASSSFVLAHAAVCAPQEAARLSPDRQVARGVVFDDADGDGARDAAEGGLAGVRVSNGRDVVATGADGRYELSVDTDDVLFVIQPRGYRAARDEHGLTRFYYVHKPAGSPPSRYPGVAPTGSLPSEIDFALHAEPEAPGQLRALLLGDPQPRDLAEVDFLAHDVLEELVGADADFGVSLGDVVFDDLSLYDTWNAAVARLGLPWHNVHGNHDMNYDASGEHADQHADETWERVFGPGTYAFDRGSAHFVVLDDVIYLGPDVNGTPRYRGGFTADQLAFLAADLALVPRDTLCVFLMHIPLPEVEPAERAAFLATFADRPHTLSIAAHYHRQSHYFLKAEDGWTGAEDHHHAVLGTIGGSWLAGLPDEYGLPHGTMSDGTPNGWTWLSIDGTSYALGFVPARRPHDFQISVHAPDGPLAGTPFVVTANVFAGSARSNVTLSLDGREEPMLLAPGPDPAFAALKALEARYVDLPGRRLPEPQICTHLWRSEIAGLTPGTHLLEVESVDMFGRKARARRLVRVVAGPSESGVPPDPAVDAGE